MDRQIDKNVVAKTAISVALCCKNPAILKDDFQYMSHCFDANLNNSTDVQRRAVKEHKTFNELSVNKMH